MSDTSDLNRYKEKFPKFFQLLVDEDVSWLSKQLQIAAMFLLSYETLKDCIENTFENFFCHEWNVNKQGQLVATHEQPFKDALKKYSPTSKQSLFGASCAWLMEMGAISRDDYELINVLSKMRNDIAHELLKILVDEKITPLEHELILIPLSLHQKISNWWLRNVERDLNPELDRYSDEDLSSAASVQVKLLHILAERLK